MPLTNKEKHCFGVLLGEKEKLRIHYIVSGESETNLLMEVNINHHITRYLIILKKRAALFIHRKERMRINIS